MKTIRNRIAQDIEIQKTATTLLTETPNVDRMKSQIDPDAVLHTTYPDQNLLARMPKVAVTHGDFTLPTGGFSRLTPNIDRMNAQMAEDGVTHIIVTEDLPRFRTAGHVERTSAEYAKMLGIGEDSLLTDSVFSRPTPTLDRMKSEMAQDGDASIFVLEDAPRFKTAGHVERTADEYAEMLGVTDTTPATSPEDDDFRI